MGLPGRWAPAARRPATETLDRFAADPAVKLLLYLRLANLVPAFTTHLGRVAPVGRIAVRRANGFGNSNLAKTGEIVTFFCFGDAHTPRYTQTPVLVGPPKNRRREAMKLSLSVEASCR